MNEYNILREIKSLLDQKQNLLKKITDEKERIQKLETSQDSAQEEIKSIQEKILVVREEFSHLEKKINLLSEQKQRLFDYGSDEDKINLLSKEMSQYEHEALELMENEDHLIQQKEEKKTFLSGLKKTLEELSSESSEILQDLNEQVSHLDLRVKLLEESLPNDFQKTFHRISSKNLIHGPFTQVQNGSCYFCRFKISRIDESEIDLQKKLKTCPQCQRIFLPYGT